MCNVLSVKLSRTLKWLRWKGLDITFLVLRNNNQQDGEIQIQEQIYDKPIQDTCHTHFPIACVPHFDAYLEHVSLNPSNSLNPLYCVM